MKESFAHLIAHFSVVAVNLHDIYFDSFENDACICSSNLRSEFSIPAERSNLEKF